MTLDVGGPGFRVYPFTHDQVGYGYLIERDDKRDALFLSFLPTDANRTLTALLAAWLHINGYDVKTWPPENKFPFVFFVRDDDTATTEAMGGLQGLYKKRYPDADGWPIFVSRVSEAEVLAAVDDVIAAWGAEHPGEPYPRSIEEAVAH